MTNLQIRDWLFFIHNLFFVPFILDAEINYHNSKKKKGSGNEREKLHLLPMGSENVFKERWYGQQDESRAYRQPPCSYDFFLAHYTAPQKENWVGLKQESYRYPAEV